MLLVVVWEFQPAQQVAAQQTEDDNPEREEYLTIEDMPTVGQISHREELQCKGQFDEAECHLDDVHPTA